jgi:hypothetical protein
MFCNYIVTSQDSNENNVGIDCISFVHIIYIHTSSIRLLVKIPAKSNSRRLNELKHIMHALCLKARNW